LVVRRRASLLDYKSSIGFPLYFFPALSAARNISCDPWSSKTISFPLSFSPPTSTATLKTVNSFGTAVCHQPAISFFSKRPEKETYS